MSSPQCDLFCRSHQVKWNGFKCQGQEDQMKHQGLRKDKISGKRKAVFILIISSISLLAINSVLLSKSYAQCYRLADDRGTIHFTDTIYRWINDKGEVYYTNYIVFLPPEKYLAIVQEIETVPPPEGIKRPQFVQDSGDIMTEMKKRFPEIGPWTWTQDMSLWVRVPASFAINKPACEELADSIARFYRTKKGHMVCVRIYYGNQKVIAYECR